jgi:hypothetical protein
MAITKHGRDNIGDRFAFRPFSVAVVRQCLSTFLRNRG